LKSLFPSRSITKFGLQLRAGGAGVWAGDGCVAVGVGGGAATETLAVGLGSGTGALAVSTATGALEEGVGSAMKSGCEAALGGGEAPDERSIQKAVSEARMAMLPRPTISAVLGPMDVATACGEGTAVIPEI
jgi:hypothetical protein